MIEAATRAAQETADIEANGTATPLPDNWRVARVVVAPNPADARSRATAVAAAAQGTAIAQTTALPENIAIWTATPRPPATARPANTPTPIYVLWNDLTATPEPAAVFVPQEFVGKILFLSDERTGNANRPDAYVVNPDGTGLARLTSKAVYDRANVRDGSSPDGRLVSDSMKEQSGERRVQLFYTNQDSGAKHQLTYHGDGVAWDAAWSPIDDRIAYVSNESGNDEIWITRPENWPGQKLTDNTWEWDHSPSWSPDGSQILYSTNQGDGKQSLWVMGPNGNSPHPFIDLPFDAWGPIWVKYAD